MLPLFVGAVLEQIQTAQQNQVPYRRTPQRMQHNRTQRSHHQSTVMHAGKLAYAIMERMVAQAIDKGLPMPTANQLYNACLDAGISFETVHDARRRFRRDYHV